jgi:hypothetical protein
VVAVNTEHVPLLPRDPQLQAIAEALSAPFDPREIKFKPQSVKNNRALAMAYIDARLIQDRLDRVLGMENWQDKYDILPDGSVMCRLRLKLGAHWVTKTDVGSPSEQPDSGDRLKAAFSDALKRAAVKFGIGRYLYRLPAQWVDYDQARKQFTQTPQLPAFALPRQEKKLPPQVEAPPVSEPKSTREKPRAAELAQPAPPAEKPVAEKPVAEKPLVKGIGGSHHNALPANGQELHRRLQDYDAKLAAQKVCVRGALLAHVTQAGVKAGYTANLMEWTGPAIPFAVEAVKEFEQTVKANGKPEPRTAA